VFQEAKERKPINALREIPRLKHNVKLWNSVSLKSDQLVVWRCRLVGKQEIFSSQAEFAFDQK